jgi:dienelactone hydrolase
MSLDEWEATAFSADGRTRTVYRRGQGPGIVVVHEIPGVTPAVVRFAEELTAAGFTVALPVLFGTPGAAKTPARTARSILRVCIAREFEALATGRTAAITRWLRALAAELHAQVGGPGVGALGMCFTGGFALVMMIDDVVIAPVVAQPSAPFAITASMRRDLGLSPADLALARQRAAAGCDILGLRFTADRLVGERFTTLRREFGDSFQAIELAGPGHSAITEDRNETTVRAVIDFFTDRLQPGRPLS